MPTSTEVIVLGLGGMGSAAVWQLARRGVKVLGLEQFSPGHDRGSSHGRTRVIRQAYFEHPSYVPLLLRAYELWREAERQSGHQLLTLCGGLMMGGRDSEVVRGSIASAKTHSLAHEILDAKEVRKRFPPFHISDDQIALFESQAGIVHTERAVLTHLDLASAYGADLRFGEAAISWQAEPGGGVSVRTANDTYYARRLILTAGPWAPRFLSELGVPLVVERQVLFWFRPRRGIRPFLPGHFPIYIWEEQADLQPYGFPAMDGPEGGVKIAFFRMPNAQICSPDTIDRNRRAEDEALMRASICKFLPELDGPLIHSTTCMYTSTPDRHFVIGIHPECPEVAYAAGFSGHGFKFCSVIGEVLAQLATEGRSNHDLKLFNPERFRSSLHQKGNPAAPGQTEPGAAGLAGETRLSPQP